LHNENALQNPTVDERHAQEGAVDLLPGFPEVLKARVIPGVLHGYRHYLFRDQSDEALVERHAQGANASRVEAKGCCQHQVRSIRLKQIG
jgi:hypothetical protein